MNRFQPHLLAVCCFVACTGATQLVSAASSEDSALQATQCTFQSFDADVKACFDAFKTCLAGSEEATAEDCRATLHACLPTPPQASADGGGMRPGCGPGMDGHMGGGRPGGPQGRDADGGEPPMSPMPDLAAVTACHDAFTACVAGGTAQDTCFATERDCVRAAFEAAFQAACDATNNASPHCQQGVDGLPPAADGGSVCTGT